MKVWKINSLRELVYQGVVEIQAVKSIVLEYGSGVSDSLTKKV